jgi:uncharacterized membrane protein
MSSSDKQVTKIDFSRRIISLDLLRTLAIVLMVIFHFIYDLRHFGWVDWDIPDGDGWRHFRYVILSLFFICVGIGLSYGHGRAFTGRKFAFRTAQVAAGAALATAMSLIMFPDYWIYFGVLHFILIASILSVGLVPYPRVATILGLLIIVSGLSGQVASIWPFDSISAYLPQYTSDYVPIVPWLGVVLVGVGIGYSRWLNADPWRHCWQAEKLAMPGKHSLLIYLIHQPILYAILTPIKWLT